MIFPLCAFVSLSFRGFTFLPYTFPPFTTKLQIYWILEGGKKKKPP
jgi:hypothetical protein